MTNTQQTEARDERLNVATTIIEQINATDRWARARWGVKQVLALGPDTKGAQLNCTKGIRILVTLENDTYTVVIGRVRGLNYKQHYEMSDVYADVLVQVIDRASQTRSGVCKS